MASVEDNILHSIKKNGYPEKRVSLPFQAIFKSCKENGVTLSNVLNNLKEQEVLHKIENDKILFYNKDYKESPPKPKDKPFYENLAKEAMNKIKDMDPAELEEMRKKVMGMPPEERDELMKRAKDLFSNKQND